MAANAKEIIKRRDQLKAKRANHESRWERHAPYMSPWSYGVVNGITDGQATQTQVYDSTAIFANDILTNFICSETIPPGEKYLTYRHSDNKVNELDEVKEWMEECTDRVLAEIARSNFYTEAPTMMGGVTGFGTGSLFRGERLRDVSERNANPGWRGLRFKCDKIGRFLVAEDQNGEIKTNFREFKYTATQIAERWKNTGPEVEQCLRNNKQDQEFAIIHAVYPRPAGERKYGAQGMPFTSCYVLDTKDGHVFEESGFEEYPFTNPRWDIIPGEVYGRCPGDIAFNDILTVNNADRLDQEAWALDARPPTFTRNDSMLGTINLVPGMFAGMRGQPNRPLSDSFYQYTSGAQHQINEIREQNKKQAIRQAYYVDQIVQMLQVEKTQMTAYEFSKKLELLFAILGPVYGRFQNEFLKPTFDGIFQDMYQYGMLPPAPPEVIDYAQENGQQEAVIDIEFQNPLARAQKTVEVQALNFAIADLTPVIQLELQLKGYSEAWDRINPDKFAMKVFDVRGVSATVVNSDKEVKAIQEARTKAQAQQNAQQEAMATAETMGKAAPALKLLQGGEGKAA